MLLGRLHLNDLLDAHFDIWPFPLAEHLPPTSLVACQFRLESMDGVLVDVKGDVGVVRGKDLQFAVLSFAIISSILSSRFAR